MKVWSPEELIKHGKIATGPIKLDANDGFMTMGLQVDGEDIYIEVEGFAMKQFFEPSPFKDTKQQLPVEVSNNGMLIAVSAQLKNAILQKLEEVCLPEVEVKVDGFVKNGQVVYVSWPRSRFGYERISTPVGEYSLDDAKPGDDPLMSWMEKNTLNTPLKLTCKLYCWLLKADEGKKLTVGISPQLKAIAQ